MVSLPCQHPAAPPQDTAALGHREVGSGPASGTMAGALPGPTAQEAGPDPLCWQCPLPVESVVQKLPVSLLAAQAFPPVPPSLSLGTLGAGGQRAWASKLPSQPPHSPLWEPSLFPSERDPCAPDLPLVSRRAQTSGPGPPAQAGAVLEQPWGGLAGPGQSGLLRPIGA